MSKYREVAIQAVARYRNSSVSDPVKTWTDSAKKIFPGSTNLQSKGCPKGAFLDLCNEGLVS
ncbi:DUF6979 family protein [Pseudohongiella acticola]|uniref:DUF6979 family protein n=1 Tax=Pseudohongiella acticola TaxID=1524254 RepID=UPI003C6E11AB